MSIFIAKMVVLLGVCVFAAHWLIYASTGLFCLVARPELPDIANGAIHPKRILGRTLYLRRFEIILLNRRGVFAAIAFLLMSALVASLYNPFSPLKQ